MEYEWTNDDTCLTKCKITNLLPPLSNSTNQPSSDKEIVSREVVSPVDSVSALTEEQNVSYNDPYHQKLPISFISPKDWQKYLHFTTSLADNFDNNESTSSYRGKSGRILRLLNSFHKLYQEYSLVCTKYAPCSQSAGDTSRYVHMYPKPFRNHESNQAGDRADSFDSNDENLVDIGIQTNISMNNKDINEFLNIQSCSQDEENEVIPPNSFFTWNMKFFFNPAKRLGKRLKQMTNISNKPKCYTVFGKSFDKIIKSENNISMNIIEHTQSKTITAHKISLTSNDRVKFNLNKFKNVQIPLALELLLPKIQMKIETILNECPFLCDPLEVAAELRQFGYDQNECINFFNDTKYLRTIIEDMMPNSSTSAINSSVAIINNSANNLDEIQSQIRSASSSALSNNSQANTHDKTDYSNETITALNSNANHNNANNHSSKQQTGLSVDRIFNAVKDLCLFSDKSHILTKSNFVTNSNSLDGITQTSMVHFYMDDKNLESFFHKVRQYLNVIRQIHQETREEVEYLGKQLCCVFSSLKSHIALMINQNSEKLLSDEQKGKMLTLAKQVEELKLKLKKEEKRRRYVYNLMQEQMGNIRVYCRCRQIVDGVNLLEIIGNETIGIPSASPSEKFEFDKVFHPGMTQGDIYEEFRPLVMSFIDGYNVCFITYGGEASGKTYTLIGGNDGPNQQGLMQRALTTILLEERVRQRDWEYRITACVVEIYNDNCIDVLSGENNIQLYVDNGMETAYQKLKSVPITNEADADALMQVCRVKRKVAKTALNPASSRSHLITLVRLQGRSKIHGENICSFLCLCDLAGFEDIIKAETQTNKILSKEAGYINRSLTAFNRVFVSLRKQDPNTVSYRDTKLTHLLKPFLTNSGKCALIVTVRNDKRSLGSTQNTLRFGRETRGVTLGRARRQVNLNAQSSA